MKYKEKNKKKINKKDRWLNNWYKMEKKAQRNPYL